MKKILAVLFIVLCTNSGLITTLNASTDLDAGIQQIGYMSQQVKNLGYRYNLSGVDEETRAKLIEMGTRRQIARKEAQAYHEHYVGTNDSVVADITNGVTTVAIYGIVGVVVSVIATPVIAATVVGVGAGVQTWLSKADEFAISYAKETGDYSLKDYDKTNDRGAFGFGCLMFVLAFVLSLAAFEGLTYTNLYKRLRGEKIEKAPKKVKTKSLKIEIVNNKQYTDSKKTDRIKYLRDLKKQTISKLNMKRQELETENNKLKDVPTDVAKYIKTKNTSSLKREISKLETKAIAIEELIESETEKSQS